MSAPSDFENFVYQMSDGLCETLERLDSRVKALETAEPSVKWAGVYAAGETYKSGDLCTRSGSLWLALRDTADAPGNGATSWRLIVKSGQV